MPGSTLQEHPDAGREGLRRVLVDGAPVLTVARAGALHPVDGTLAELLGAGRERLHEAVDRALQRAPLTAPAKLLAPVDEQEVWASGVTYRRSATARVEESSVGDVYELVYEAAAARAVPQGAGVARARRPARRCASAPTRPGTSPSPSSRSSSTPAARSSAISRPTTSRRARSRAPTRSTCRRPRSTTTRSACRARSSWPATRLDPRSAAIELEIHRDGERVFAGETSVGEMKRGFDELVAALYLELSFPAGAVLLTGTGVVPPDEFTLRDGDRVRIAVEGVGVLEHDIYRSSG